MSVCVSVCLLVTFVSLAETVKPIAMPFGGWLKEPSIRWGQGRTNSFAPRGVTRLRYGLSSKFFDHLLMFSCYRENCVIDLWMACSNKDQLESRDELGPDYQYSVDGFYTTRGTSLDHATPFIRGTDDDSHLSEFTTTPRVHHGCLVVEKSLAGYGTTTTPASRLCHHATPTPVTSCADCQLDYDRRRVAKTTAAAPDSSVDVTMTTTTSSRQKDKAHRHHVYELPHVIWCDTVKGHSHYATLRTAPRHCQCERPLTSDLIVGHRSEAYT